MPNAIGIAARSMGMANGEFIKLVSSGKVLAEDFMPKFANELRRTAREGGALDKALNSSRKRMDAFSTAFQVNVGEMFEAGTESGLASFFKDLTGIMEEMKPGFRIMGRVLGSVFGAIGIGLRAITQLFRPFTAVIDAATDGTGLLGTTLSFLGSALQAIAGVLLLPFGLMEMFNDKIQELNGFAKEAASVGMMVLQASIIAMTAKLLGLGKALGAVSAGIIAIATVIKTRLLAAIALLSLHPAYIKFAAVVLALAAAGAGLSALYNYVTGGSDSAGVTSTAVSNSSSGTTYKYNTMTINVEDGDPEKVKDAVRDVLTEDIEAGTIGA